MEKNKILSESERRDISNVPIIKEDYIIQGIGEIKTKEYDPAIEGHKMQMIFDKIATYLGMVIILFYLGIVTISFLLNVFNLCTSCYPEYLERFETLVLIIIGFFFGTRLITQYAPKK